jgi:hypothetical protein
MRRLRLGFVLGGLLVLAGAGRIGDSTPAAETSAGPPLAVAVWAPSMKVVQFTPRGPDGRGGGDATEDIRVHEVPVDSVLAWLGAQEVHGVLVDLKVYAALYFCQKPAVGV